MAKKVSLETGFGLGRMSRAEELVRNVAAAEKVAKATVVAVVKDGIQRGEDLLKVSIDGREFYSSRQGVIHLNEDGYCFLPVRGTRVSLVFP